MSPRLRKTLLLALAAVGVAAAALVLGVAEVRYTVGYELFPEATRDAGFDKYTARSGATLYHLGTIHGRHLDEEAYGLGHLEALVGGAVLTYHHRP